MAISPFYVQFSIFTITNRVSAIRLHIYSRTIYRIFLLCDVTSRDVRAKADRDPQNIADLRKDCGSVADEKLWALHRRNLNRKTVPSQGNRAMPQLFFSV